MTEMTYTAAANESYHLFHRLLQFSEIHIYPYNMEDR